MGVVGANRGENRMDVEEVKQLVEEAYREASNPSFKVRAEISEMNQRSNPVLTEDNRRILHCEFVFSCTSGPSSQQL